MLLKVLQPINIMLSLQASGNVATNKMADCESIEQLLDLWLHGKSKQCQRAYRGDVTQFLVFCDGKSLLRVTLNDVQAFSTALEQQGYSSATRNRRLSAVKSLLSFGHKIGYLPYDVGAPVEAPPVKNTLAERILSELEVMTMIALETNHRNKLLVRFLYLSGARVSEVSQLCWCDLKAVGERGQVTLFGKGGKTRIVALPSDFFKELNSLRGGATTNDPVFVSRKGGKSLKPNQIRNIVSAAGKRAGIDGSVSCHWLRHSHASHSLDRGASIQLVQATLGHASVATTSRYLHAKPNDSSALYLPG